MLIFKAYSVQTIGDYITGKCLEYMIKPNLEVKSVGDTVKYKYTNPRQTTEIECLRFKDTDYGCVRSVDNNYYIIDGEYKVKPLNLKVGDKLYFEIKYSEYNLDKKTEVVVGGYLYLVNTFVNNNDNT